MTTTPDEFELISLDELKRHKGKAFDFRHPSFGLHGIAVFWDGEAVYAIEDSCPHLFGSLADGMVRKGEVSCPLHGAQFDLATGKCTDLFTIDTTAYKAEVRDGMVWVMAPGEQRDKA